MDLHEVIIIGAGPAGIGAAIQLRRHGLDPLLLEKDAVGGLLRNANRVENYPGFRDGLSGPELVEHFQQHLEDSGSKVVFEQLTGLEYEAGRFILHTTGGKLFSRIVVIASGTRPRRVPDLDLPPSVQGRVHYEVHHLTGVSEERIAILGAGDAAFDNALNLSSRNRVTILNRGTRVRGLPLLFDRCQADENISYLENTRLLALEPGAECLNLRCLEASGELELKVDSLLIAIGREPCLDFLDEGLVRDLEALQASGKLHLIGDVKQGNYRQTAIALGEGLKAAMDISRTLTES